MSDHITSRINAVNALPPLRDVIAKHSLSAQKSLGQNFLLDMNITDKIVREAILRDNNNWSDVNVFEIGSGPGGLTRSLLRSSAKTVKAIELDKRAVLALHDLVTAANGDLEILPLDAMKVDLTSLCSAPRVIVANLPYNIATPLLINWLKQIRDNNKSYKSMTLMFQKEVADRICAKPNSRTYGRLAIISQWLCNVTKIYDLPPSAFTPPPKVMSAVVHFSPKILPDNAPKFSTVESVTAAAFNQRRKMIRSSLKNYMPAIESLNIDPQKRAENLYINEYIDIAKF